MKAQASLENDERFTPPDMLRSLHAQYAFTLDLASSPLAPAAQILPRYLTRENSAFQYRIPAEERVWCNPPYSNIPLWISFLWAQPCWSMMLVPAWTDRAWWHEYVEPFRDRPGTRLHTQFIRRVLFGDPEQPVRKSGSPKFIGSVLITLDRMAA